MDINFELRKLMERAKCDEGLKKELLKTREAEDAVKAFCDKCQSLGYRSVTVYELLTAGETFVAAMLRSVNGGGQDAPNDFDDFYEMFFDELEGI